MPARLIGNADSHENKEDLYTHQILPETHPCVGPCASATENASVRVGCIVRPGVQHSKIEKNQ